MRKKGICKGFTVVENRDSNIKTVMVSVLFDDEADVQEIEYPQNGFDRPPYEGCLVYAEDTDTSWPYISGIDDNTESDTDAGDHTTYAVKDEKRVAAIRQTKDGMFEFRPDDSVESKDFLVRYTELEKAYLDLQAKHNALCGVVTAMYTAAGAVPPVPPVIGSVLKDVFTSASSVSTTCLSTMPLTPAKITEMLVP